MKRILLAFAFVLIASSAGATVLYTYDWSGVDGDSLPGWAEFSGSGSHTVVIHPAQPGAEFKIYVAGFMSSGYTYWAITGTSWDATNYKITTYFNNDGKNQVYGSSAIIAAEQDASNYYRFTHYYDGTNAYPFVFTVVGSGGTWTEVQNTAFVYGFNNKIELITTPGDIVIKVADVQKAHWTLDSGSQFSTGSCGLGANTDGGFSTAYWYQFYVRTSFIVESNTPPVPTPTSTNTQTSTPILTPTITQTSTPTPSCTPTQTATPTPTIGIYRLIWQPTPGNPPAGWTNPKGGGSVSQSGTTIIHDLPASTDSLWAYTGGGIWESIYSISFDLTKTGSDQLDYFMIGMLYQAVLHELEPIYYTSTNMWEFQTDPDVGGTYTYLTHNVGSPIGHRVFIKEFPGPYGYPEVKIWHDKNLMMDCYTYAWPTGPTAGAFALYARNLDLSNPIQLQLGDFRVEKNANDPDATSTSTPTPVQTATPTPIVPPISSGVYKEFKYDNKPRTFRLP
jgi:hypothetical protein